jgi:NADH-quinone oxidoreductase subunit M
MIILAAFQANFWYAFLAATTLILGAAYSLWMVKRVIFGDIDNDNVAALNDLNQREFWMMATLAVIVLAIGLWPQPLTDVMHASVEHLLTQILQSKL